MYHFGGMYIGYIMGTCLCLPMYFLQWLPKYLLYQKLRVCVICTSIIQGVFQNRLDHFIWMSVPIAICLQKVVMQSQSN
jgi:hypothetical protein